MRSIFQFFDMASKQIPKFCLGFILSLNFLWENSFFSLRKSFIVNNGFRYNSECYCWRECTIFVFTRFTNGWSLILTSCKELEYNSCYTTLDWWRELLSMGSSCEESFTHQEQIGIYWWFSHLIISIGVYSFNYSSLD